MRRRWSHAEPLLDRDKPIPESDGPEHGHKILWPRSGDRLIFRQRLDRVQDDGTTHYGLFAHF
jgi:hypothetical protein